MIQKNGKHRRMPAVFPFAPKGGPDPRLPHIGSLQGRDSWHIIGTNRRYGADTVSITASDRRNTAAWNRKRTDRAGNGHARPERSGAEAADVQRSVRERYGGLLLRPEKRKKCRLQWEVYNLVVYYFQWLVLHYVTTIFQYHRWYQNLRAAGGLQWSGRHGGNAYE